MRHSAVSLNLDQFRENVSTVLSSLGETTLIFVIKADAYGHGMDRIAPAALASGIDTFAVAHVHEAVELRSIAPTARIIIMAPIAVSDSAAVVMGGFELVVTDVDQLSDLDAAAAGSSELLKVHVKLDTGMGRFGILWTDVGGLVDKVAACRFLSLVGACSHFSSADEDAAYSAIQIARFREAVTELESTLGRSLEKHLANSAGVQYVDGALFDSVRMGLILLGYNPGCGGRRVDTRPVLSWRSVVSQLRNLPPEFPIGYGGTFVTDRETRLAVCPVGYADGYSRALSNVGVVLIDGVRCPIRGRVSMNSMTVDVTNCAHVAVGDSVTLIGEDGDEVIDADDLAVWSGSVSYEVLTGIRSLRTD